MPSAPSTLTGNLQLSGTSKITGGIAGGSQQENVQVGQNTFPTINPQVTQAAAAGAVGQCTKHYQGQVTVGASSQSTLALTGLTDGLGDSISFTNIKMLAAAILSPGGTKSVAIGAMGIANGWYSPFAAVTTNGATLAGIAVGDCAWLSSTLATTGFTAGAGNYQLGIQNLTATTATVQILIWGN